MDISELLEKTEYLLSRQRLALLSTTDIHGKPNSRWMIPTFMPGKEGYLYSVTGADFRKVRDIESNPSVSWLIQKSTMDEIIRLYGNARIKTDSELITKIVKMLDPQLTVLWRLRPEKDNLIVIETRIHTLEYFLPMEGEREILEV